MGRKSLKLITLLLGCALLLASCSEQPKGKENYKPRPIRSIEGAVSLPRSCEGLGVEDILKESFPNFKYIKTDWNPSPGSDLALAYQSGGLACTYGDLSSEVGVTMLWGRLSNSDFNERINYWEEQDYLKIENIDYKYELKLKDGLMSPDGKLRFSRVYYKGGVWFQINYSFPLTEDYLGKLAQSAYELN